MAPVRAGAAVARSWWTVVGVLLGLGVVGLLTVGAVLLAVALALALVGTRWHRTRGRSAWMVLTGVAAAPLLVAWHNRRGPGRACAVEGDVTSCSEQWAPWPFLAVSLLLAATGVLLARRSAGPERS